MTWINLRCSYRRSLKSELWGSARDSPSVELFKTCGVADVGSQNVWYLTRWFRLLAELNGHAIKDRCAAGTSAAFQSDAVEFAELLSSHGVRVEKLPLSPFALNHLHVNLGSLGSACHELIDVLPCILGLTPVAFLHFNHLMQAITRQKQRQIVRPIHMCSP